MGKFARSETPRVRGEEDRPTLFGNGTGLVSMLREGRADGAEINAETR